MEQKSLLPKGAIKFVAPQFLSAPFGGGMSEGQIGAALNTDFCKSLIIFS
jgi:hypothetical protein